MNEENNIKIFEDKTVRTLWSEEEEKWYFSVIDIIGILTDNDYQHARNYWKVLKNRLKVEGNQTVTNCNQLKLKANDGKMRLTDVADTEQLLRIIQSIPSPKAEPFKIWLAKVGKERIDENYDPEITINRALENYRRKGYSEEWINQRLKTIDVRKEFTDELKRSGINSQRDYAILTNILTETWSGYTVKEYKNLKRLKKENLRDNMSNMELVLNMLEEISSTEISKGVDPKGFDETKIVVVQGGNIAKNAKEQIEKASGKKIITNENAKQLREKNNKLLS